MIPCECALAMMSRVPGRPNLFCDDTPGGCSWQLGGGRLGGMGGKAVGGVNTPHHCPSIPLAQSIEGWHTSQNKCGGGVTLNLASLAKAKFGRGQTSYG